MYMSVMQYSDGRGGLHATHVLFLHHLAISALMLLVMPQFIAFYISCLYLALCHKILMLA